MTDSGAATGTAMATAMAMATATAMATAMATATAEDGPLVPPDGSLDGSLDGSSSSLPPPPTRDYSRLRKAAASQSLARLKEEISAGEWKARDIDDNDAYNHSKGRQRQRQHASKSALHMAAWKGCLDNVRYLLEKVGCDIDAYSRQEFSYGKTAIFFALTQSRIDVTEYLLERGAKVTIVNNKGQSVLSMAATHFPSGGDNDNDSDNNDESESNAGARIVRTIQTLERAQGDWWNFRASHSDGFEYGDLDPRFFADRPLSETDVVTPLAINPTTRETRKGGFLKRNPGAASRPFNRNCEKKPRAKANAKAKARGRAAGVPAGLPPGEREELDRAWGSLVARAASPEEPAAGTTTEEEQEQERQSPPTATTTTTTIPPPSTTTTTTPSLSSQLLRIVRLSDRQRLPWIPTTAAKLKELFGSEQTIGLLEGAIRDPAATKRQIKLLHKIRGRLGPGGVLRPTGGGNRARETRSEDDPTKTEQDSDHDQGVFLFSSFHWATARAVVRDLSVSVLEPQKAPPPEPEGCLASPPPPPQPPVLSLPEPPVFVDSPAPLEDLLARVEAARLVAIDTEWYAPGTSGTGGPRTALSILQLSFVAGEVGGGADPRTPVLANYVVDLKKAEESCAADHCIDNEDDDEYRCLAKRLVGKLLGLNGDGADDDAGPLVLGFAIKHDLHYLEAFLDKKSGGHGRPLATPAVTAATTGAAAAPSGTHADKPSAIVSPRLLDLQAAMAAAVRSTGAGSATQRKPRSQLPGLRSCAARYSDTPLSKDHQCSDWGRRPLSEAQLGYAGLDAAVLLVLLAERSREAEAGGEG